MKVLIFDLGNVLFRFDPMIMTHAHIPAEQDAALCAPAIFDRRLWDRLDLGTISDEEVLADIRQHVPPRLADAACAVYTDWYANMPEICGMRQLVSDLKAAGHRLYLLSNISIGFAQGYAAVAPVASLLALFDGCVFSGPLHMVKPDREIFEHLLRQFALRREECLFIDDSEKNVAGAAAVGISALRFDGQADTLRAALQTML